MDRRPTPRFNHVAVTVPADALDAEGRAALLRFYGEVFGWTEMPTMTKDREVIVLRAHRNDQFVFVHASEKPLAGDGSEHFGMSVATPAQLDEVYERAREFAERDPAVKLLERKAEDYEVLTLHSFYVGYRLPLMVEVQCFEWAPGFDASRLA